MPEKIGRNDPCPCGSGRKYKYCCGRPRGMTGADVLYIHPSKQGVDFEYDWHRAGNAYLFMPMGVIGLANLLRERGITVQGVNLALEKMLDEEFELRDWLSQWSGVHLVMIDLHWYEHSYGAIDVVRACREALPQARIVLGGFTASVFSQEILSSFPEVDFIIRGDAERPLLELAKQLLRGGGHSPKQLHRLSDIPNLSYRVGAEIAENERGFCASSAELDELNFVDTDFLEHHKEYYAWQYQRTEFTLPLDFYGLQGHWLCIGRGCCYECAFCGGCRSAQRTLAGRDTLVMRSPQAVADDIKRLEDMGIKQVSLSFDIAVLEKECWSQLLTDLRRRRIQIGLYDELFQLPSDDFVQEFARTGVMAHSRLALSPLSGCERVRHLNGKLYSNDDFFHTLALFKECEVSLFVYFSLNLPGENEETFEETLQMAKKISDYYPAHLLKMVNMCHTIDPCSPMSLEPERYSIQVYMRTFTDYYDYCRSTSLAGPEARTGARRGFTTTASAPKSLETMAQKWDELSGGSKSSWWPIPPSW